MSKSKSDESPWVKLLEDASKAREAVRAYVAANPDWPNMPQYEYLCHDYFANCTMLAEYIMDGGWIRLKFEVSHE